MALDTDTMSTLSALSPISLQAKAKATKSKLNSKLPGVAKIAFCSAAGKNMSKTLFTGENGKFTRKVGFQQKSKKYPYQIQFRQRSRYVADIAKRKGAN